MTHQRLPPPPLPHAHSAFKMHDMDGDGAISRDDLTAYLRLVTTFTSPEEEEEKLAAMVQTTIEEISSNQETISTDDVRLRLPLHSPHPNYHTSLSLSRCPAHFMRRTCLAPHAFAHTCFAPSLTPLYSSTRH